MNVQIHSVKKHVCLLLVALWIILPARSVFPQSAPARPELALQTGHFGSVLSAAFSPDSQTLATVGDDWNVRLWDVKTKQVLRTLHGHTSSVASVAFSPNGRFLATGEFGTEVRLWDPRSGAERFTIVDSELVTALSFSPDNKVLAIGVGSDAEHPGKIRIYDLAQRKVTFSLDENSNGISELQFSPDSQMLVSGGQDGKLKLWDLKARSLKREWDAHAGEGVSSFAILPGGKSVVSGGLSDGTIKFWKLATGELERTIDGEPNERNFVGLNLVCKCLVIGNAEVKLYDLTTSNLQKALVKKTISSKKVLISPNGEHVLNIGVELNGADADADVYFWKAKTGEFHGKLSAYKQGVVATIYNPLSDTIIAADSDRRVITWDLHTGNVLATQQMTEEIKVLALSRDGKTLAVGGSDFGKPGVVYLFDLTTKQLKHKLTGHLLTVRSVAFSKDGATLLSGSEDGTLKLWNVATGQEQQTIKNSKLPVLSVAFSPDESALLAGSLDGTVRVHDRGTATVLKELKDQTSGVFVFAFSNDGKTLISSGANTNGFSSWDTATWTLNKSVRNFLLSPNAIQFADNKTVVVSNQNGQVQLWDPVTGKMIRKVTTHDLAGSSLVVIKNHYLASGSHDGVIRLLDLNNGRTMATFYSPRIEDIEHALQSQALSRSANGEFFTITPEGYFDATPIGEFATMLRVNNHLIRARQVHSKNYRPKLVRKSLRFL